MSFETIKKKLRAWLVDKTNGSNGSEKGCHYT